MQTNLYLYILMMLFLISDFIGLCKASYILSDSVITIQIQYPCYLYVILLVVIYDKIEFCYLEY